MAHGKDSGSKYENSDNREAPNKHQMGAKKYRERIARDNNGSGGPSLPFEFVKPPRNYQPKKEIFHVCDYCFAVNLVSKYSAGIQCSGCRKFNSTHKDNTFKCEEDLDNYLEMLGL